MINDQIDRSKNYEFVFYFPQLSQYQVPSPLHLKQLPQVNIFFSCFQQTFKTYFTIQRRSLMLRNK